MFDDEGMVVELAQMRRAREARWDEIAQIVEDRRAQAEIITAAIRSLLDLNLSLDQISKIFKEASAEIEVARWE